MSHGCSVSEYLFHGLREMGIERIFGVPGDFSLGMLDRLEELQGVQWTGCATELGAAYAADGYARARGFGVLCTTFGVGELSAACGVAGSTAEDVAVLHIVAAPSSSAMEAGTALHHTFGDGRFDRFTRASAELVTRSAVLTRAHAAEEIDELLRRWRIEGGTRYLLVPQDVAELRVDPSSVGSRDCSLQPSSDDSVQQELEHEMKAFREKFQNPILLVGHKLQRAGLKTGLEGCLEAGLEAAVLPNAKGLIDEDHANYLGVYNGKLGDTGVKTAVESDRGRVLLGCTLADTTTGGLSHEFPASSTLSLDEFYRERNETLTPVALAKALALCRRLLGPSVTEDSSKSSHRAGEAASWPRLTAGVSASSESMTQSELWAAMAEVMPSGVRLFAETGSPNYGALDIAFPAATIFEVAAVWAAIGFALPAALGASLGDPATPVLVVTGEGSAQMTFSELALIERYGARAIIVVVENGGYTVERVIRGEHASYNDVALWDWTAAARTHGVRDHIVTHEPVTAGDFARDLSLAFADMSRSHLLVVRMERMDATPTLLSLGRLLRAKAAREGNGTK